jgi:hypothetical protein
MFVLLDMERTRFKRAHWKKMQNWFTLFIIPRRAEKKFLILKWAPERDSLLKRADKLSAAPLAPVIYYCWRHKIMNFYAHLGLIFNFTPLFALSFHKLLFCFILSGACTLTLLMKFISAVAFSPQATLDLCTFCLLKWQNPHLNAFLPLICWAFHVLVHKLLDLYLSLSLFANEITR